MARNDRAVPSTAAIAGHPIHPMIVPFPIAFLTGAFVSDIAFWLSNNAFWAQLSFWLILAGIVMGALAAIFGLVDFLTKAEIRSYSAAWVHFLGNGLAILISLVNLLLRIGDPTVVPLPLGLILSLVVTGILVITGWLGGELSYRHRIGVVPSSDTEMEDTRGPEYRRTV